MSIPWISLFYYMIISLDYFGKAKNYHFYAGSETFDDGIELCDNEGYELASIKTADELNEAKDFIRQSMANGPFKIWIGLRYDELSREFRWLDGDQFTLNNFWDIGEPDCFITVTDSCNSDVLQLCLRVTYYQGSNSLLFKTRPCFRTYNVLCSEKVPPGPAHIIAPSLIVEGQSVTMTCSSTGGSPVPTVRWFKGDTEITTGVATTTLGNTVTATLVFTAAKADHYAVYECQVDNGVLQSPLKDTENVFVNYPPDPPTLTGPTTLTAGDPGVWRCLSNDGYPAGVMTMKNLNTNTQFPGSQFTSASTADEFGFDVTGTLDWTPALANNGHNICCNVAHDTTLGAGNPQEVCLTLTINELTTTNAQTTTNEQSTDVQTTTNEQSTDVQTTTNVQSTDVQTTTNEQSTDLETSPVLSMLQCQCPCDKVGKKIIDIILSNITFQALKEIVLEDFSKRIKPEITISKKDISKTIRTKTSIYENSTVSKSFGWLAISIFSVVFVLIIGTDCMNLCIRK